MRAAARWVQTGLRARRGEAVFIVSATAGIIVSLLLAWAMLEYAANPWQRLFASSNGAHVVIHTGPRADAGRLADLDGVSAATDPFSTTQATAELSGTTAPVELRAGSAEPSEAARPLLESGRWLRQGENGAVVLESSLAAALWAEPGDTVKLRARGSDPVALTVAGIAAFSEQPFSPGERSGVGWVLPSALERVQPDAEHREPAIGLRLDNPGDTDFVVQRAVTELGADQITQVATWQQARAGAERDNRLLGQLLGLFGLGALVAVTVAVTGAINARVHGQLRDISVLKAIGFTPAQVVRMFLLEQLVFAVTGVALGAALIEVLGGRIPGRMGQAMALWQAMPEHHWILLAMCAGAVAVIGSITGLAAWRAGRVPPVPTAGAVRGGRGMSRSARLALRLRTPPALILGWRGAFHRPGYSLAAVARLAVPLLMITVALGTWATLDGFASRPERVGLPALSARAEGMEEHRIRQLLADQPDVAAAYPGAEVPALVPGQTGTITLRGLGTANEPYPFAVAEGRAPEGPDEAVAGQGLLDLLDVRVGDWVRVTVGGTPHVLHIVGRSIEPEERGQVVSATLDTLTEQDPSLGLEFYQLRLVQGADPQAVSAALAQESGGRLEARKVPNPAQPLSNLRVVIVGLVAVLALIALAELSTTIGAGVRERARDLLALKAIGLTPRQITAVIVVSTGLIALAAAALGTLLGVLASRWLIDLQGRSSGVGAGIAQGPSAAVLLLVAGCAVAGAVAVSILPAARASRRRLADTLSAIL